MTAHTHTAGPVLGGDEHPESSAIVIVDDETCYAAAAAAYRPGMPVPVLVPPDAGPQLAELVSRLRSARQITADSPSWPGAVLVTDPQLSGPAEVLARATGRPLRPATPAEAAVSCQSGPSTVLAPTEAITPNWLASLPLNAVIGVLPADSVAQAALIVAKTLLLGPVAAQAAGDLAFDTLADETAVPDTLTGPDVTPAAVRAALTGGVAILAGRAHGRDCLVHLNGGGICGRRMAEPLLLITPAPDRGHTRHLTACQQGAQCWRDDVKRADHLRAGTLNAAFVLLDSCRTAVSGAGAVRPDVSLPLSMLHGQSIGVVVASGTRGGLPEAGALFRALVRGGHSLGAAVAELNGAIDVHPQALGRLVLFGDAGLVPVPGRAIAAVALDPATPIVAGPDAVLVAGAHLMPQAPDGPLVITRADRRSAWALTGAVGRAGGLVVDGGPPLLPVLVDRVRPWIDRLGSLAEIGFRVEQADLDAALRDAITAARSHLGAVSVEQAQAASESMSAVLDRLAGLQNAMLTDEVSWVRSTFHSFVDGWPQPWLTITDDTPSACPQCMDTTVWRHRVRPDAGLGPELVYMVCTRCGEVLSGSAEPGVSTDIKAPADVLLGTEFPVDVRFTAPPDREVAIAVGAGIVYEERFHSAMADMRALALSPGEDAGVRFTGTSDPTRTIPDQLEVRVIVLADGVFHGHTRLVWTRARAWSQAEGEGAS